MKQYGRGYEMYYVDDIGNIGITYLDPMESFMVYDESILMRPRYLDRKSTRLNSSHVRISYAVFCLKKKTKAMVVSNGSKSYEYTQRQQDNTY